MKTRIYATPAVKGLICCFCLPISVASILFSFSSNLTKKTYISIYFIAYSFVLNLIHKQYASPILVTPWRILCLKNWRTVPRSHCSMLSLSILAYIYRKVIRNRWRTVPWSHPSMFSLSTLAYMCGRKPNSFFRFFFIHSVIHSIDVIYLCIPHFVLLHFLLLERRRVAFMLSRRRWANVALMLGQRRRRWPNIKTTLGPRLIFAVFTLSR